MTIKSWSSLPIAPQCSDEVLVICPCSMLSEASEHQVRLEECHNLSLKFDSGGHWDSHVFDGIDIYAFKLQNVVVYRDTGQWLLSASSYIGWTFSSNVHEREAGESVLPVGNPGGQSMHVWLLRDCCAQEIKGLRFFEQISGDVQKHLPRAQPVIYLKFASFPS